MKHFSAVIVAAMAVLVGPAVRAETPATLTDEQQVLALEQEWITAEPAHDVATLERILHDQFLSRFGAEKPLDKKAFIAAVTKGPVDPSLNHTLTDQTVIINGDTAIVMETDTIRRIKDGQPVERVHRFTVTYIRREGRWQALAEQSARVPAKTAEPVQATQAPGAQNPRPQVVGSGQDMPVIIPGNQAGRTNVGLKGINVKLSNYSAYLQKMVEAIEVQFDKLNHDSQVPPPDGSSVTVKLLLNSKGRVSGIISVDQTKATEAAAKICTQAINDSQPYGPWTEDMKAMLGNAQELTFEFHWP